MKLAIFTNVESYRLYLNQRIDAYSNELKVQRDMLKDMLAGIGKAEWLEMNHVGAEHAEQVWGNHIEWQCDSIRHVERKLKGFKRELAKIGG